MTPTFPHAETHPLDHWSNFSGTLHARDVPVFVTPRAVDGPLSAPGALIPQASAVREVVRYCFEHGLPLRAMGSRWSFTRLLQPDKVILDPAYLNGMLQVGDASLDPAYRDGRARQGFTPYWIQGGRTVAAINQRLLEEGSCLQTSGADDGHRLAGAIATGTHSSALDVGAMHDAVLALHLVVEPDRAILVQSSSRPTLSAAFVAWLEAQTGIPTEMLADDELFRAALVSLGSLGFVFSAVVEAVPAYRLQPRVKRYRRRDPELWQVIDRLHTSAAFPDRPDRPFHLDVVFNPYGAGEGSAWLTAMWATRAPTAAPAFAQPLPLAIPSDLMGLISRVADALDGLPTGALTTEVLAGVVTDQVEDLYRNAELEGFPGQIFGSNDLPAGTGASTEIVFDHRHTRDVVAELWEVLAQRAEHGEHVLGGMALRFAPQSAAHLAMNCRPRNAYLEFPAVRSAGTLAVFRAMWERLDAQGIPFTCHWGQLHGLTPGHLRRWFGDRVDRWTAARQRILPLPLARTVFGAPLLADLGLDRPTG